MFSGILCLRSDYQLWLEYTADNYKDDNLKLKLYKSFFVGICSWMSELIVCLIFSRKSWMIVNVEVIQPKMKVYGLGGIWELLDLCAFQDTDRSPHGQMLIICAWCHRLIAWDLADINLVFIMMLLLITGYIKRI